MTTNSGDSTDGVPDRPCRPQTHPSTHARTRPPSHARTWRPRPHRAPALRDEDTTLAPGGCSGASTGESTTRARRCQGRGLPRRSGQPTRAQAPPPSAPRLPSGYRGLHARRLGPRRTPGLGRGATRYGAGGGRTWLAFSLGHARPPRCAQPPKPLIHLPFCPDKMIFVEFSGCFAPYPFNGHCGVRPFCFLPPAPRGLWSRAPPPPSRLDRGRTHSAWCRNPSWCHPTPPSASGARGCVRTSLGCWR